MPSLKQFPYDGLEFRGDHELVLPPPEAWGEISKFLSFILYDFFMIFIHKVIYTYEYELDRF